MLLNSVRLNQQIMEKCSMQSQPVTESTTALYNNDNSYFLLPVGKVLEVAKHVQGRK